jgi:hypothetical protein
MNKPYITWYSRIGDDTYAAQSEIYAGTYTKKENIRVDIQIWNNRWGTEDVESLNSFALNMYFDSLEDSALLQCCKVILGGTDELPLIITGQKATVSFPDAIMLSGVKNNGASANSQENYISLTFEFSASEYRLKENDLKSLYFEIISLD